MCITQLSISKALYTYSCQTNGDFHNATAPKHSLIICPDSRFHSAVESLDDLKLNKPKIILVVRSEKLIHAKTHFLSHFGKKK